MIEQRNDPTGREFFKQSLTFDLVVVGAGPAGICAAIAAAREGARTALITDRPVLGGSASSEVQVPPNGADQPSWNRFARETGIMEEITLRLAHKAHLSGMWRWLYYDESFFDLCAAEPNLTFFLNTSVFRVNGTPGAHIVSVEALQLRAEKFIEFTAAQFIDASGDGTVGFLAGADYRFGREARAEFGERHAPEQADTGTMGATLLFTSVDRGHPVPFTAPAWALDVHALPTLLEPAKMVHRNFYRCPDGHWGGLWWAEYGGAVDSIHDDDDVMWHTRRLVYGLWDYIKNSGKFAHVERQEIDWVAPLPGKRESRRLLGPLLVTATDFHAQREYDDAIGFCGWSIDVHPPQGYLDPLPAATHDAFPGIADIPFRCLYSRNVDNLLFAGRNVSVSHEGLGTVRVIATTAVMGQAVGTAAALALREGLRPAEIYERRLPELRRLLARNDQSLVGYRLAEPDDLSREARARASSERVVAVTEGTQWLTLTGDHGLLLPVESPRLETVSFLLKTARRTELGVQVFTCDKPQNYRMQRLARELTVPCEGEAWVTLPLGVEPGPGQKVFIVLRANPDICMGYARTRLTGVLGLEYWPWEATPAETGFSSKPFTPCFRTEPEQRLYRAENVINGYARPHGLPHLWASGPMDPAEPTWLELSFAEPKTVRRVELVFNTDLNTKRIDLSGMYPGLVRDYDVLAIEGSAAVAVVRERGNIMRFRRHTFEPVRATAVRLQVHGTWGGSCAEVFDARVY
ncbi:MAG: FAD-dependent oxidoreductase [Candidatus Marinimicrobia bacterium]|nr:FAD-dependent oxidoreductase [Candidatus Neomarinimicrobiota bacterium]